MVTQSLIDYIKNQLGQNVQAEKIKNDLRAAGWQDEDVESGFRAVEALTEVLNLEVEPRIVRQEVKSSLPDNGVPAEMSRVEPEAGAEKPEPAEQAGPVTETDRSVEAEEATREPKILPSENFPREKRLEEKNKQKRIFRSVLNVVSGVLLGVGLTLGAQFFLERLFVGEPEPSPSPVIRPSPLAIGLSDAPYKNEELGIEVFYPSGWSRNLDLEGAASGVKSVFFESGDLANVLVEILPIDPLEKNVSLENVLEKSLAGTKSRHPDFVSLGQTKFSVSDLPAYVVDGGYSFQEGLNLKMKVLQAVFINESREFYVNVTLAAKEEDWSDYRPVYQRIIDGFKLTK